MTIENIVLAVIAAGSVIAACGMALYMSRLLNNLDNMLEEAISGIYEESRYDESRISKLEAKLSRFLSVSSLSRKRLIQDYENISQTVTDMSHQTKTPIANIMMYTELLEEITEGGDRLIPGKENSNLRGRLHQGCLRTGKRLFLFCLS